MCTHSDYWNCLFCCTGKNLLLFTFPIMFIASLSCVYLHLQTKKPKPSSSVVAVTSTERRFASMRRPLMVRAPLGIVTTVELCFTLMFVALLIWSLYNYLYVSFTHLHTNMHGRPGEKTYVPYTPLIYNYIRIIYIHAYVYNIIILQMAKKVQKRVSEAGLHRKHVLGFSLLSGDERVIDFASCGSHIGVEYKVPHLAWTSVNGSIWLPHTRVYRLLGNDQSNG